MVILHTYRFGAVIILQYYIFLGEEGGGRSGEILKWGGVSTGPKKYYCTAPKDREGKGREAKDQDQEEEGD